MQAMDVLVASMIDRGQIGDIASQNEKVINEFKIMNKVITDYANIK